MPVIIVDTHKYHEIRTTPNGIFVTDRRIEGNRSNSVKCQSYSEAIKLINKDTNRRII